MHNIVELVPAFLCPRLKLSLSRFPNQNIPKPLSINWCKFILQGPGNRATTATCRGTASAISRNSRHCSFWRLCRLPAASCRECQAAGHWANPHQTHDYSFEQGTNSQLRRGARNPTEIMSTKGSPVNIDAYMCECVCVCLCMSEDALVSQLLRLV